MPYVPSSSFKPFTGPSFKLGGALNEIPTVKTDYLHLDTLHTFNEVFSMYRLNAEKASCISFFKVELLSRVTILAQMVVVLVTGIFKQTVRFITFLVAGILTLNHRRVLFSFKDLLSIPIQFIALPILGVIGFFSPESAENMGLSLVNKLNPSCTILGSTNDADWGQKIDFDSNYVADFFERVTMPLQVVATTISKICRDILSMNVGLRTGKNYLALLGAPLFIFAPQRETISQYQGFLKIVPGAN